MVESAKMLPAHFSWGYSEQGQVLSQQVQDNLGIYSRDNVQRILNAGAPVYDEAFY